MRVPDELEQPDVLCFRAVPTVLLAHAIIQLLGKQSSVCAGALKRGCRVGEDDKKDSERVNQAQ